MITLVLSKPDLIFQAFLL